MQVDIETMLKRLSLLNFVKLYKEIKKIKDYDDAHRKTKQK